MIDYPKIDQVLREPLIAQALCCNHADLHRSDDSVNWAIFRMLLEKMDRLAKSVQFPEFTEHGLPHIHSLIQRVSTWTLKSGDLLIEKLSSTESFLLAFAIVTHDFGMLSQKADELPDDLRTRYAPQFVDMPVWVRRTHVVRLPRLLQKVFSDHELVSSFTETALFRTGCAMAQSHQEWPEDKTKVFYPSLAKFATSVGSAVERLYALAAVLAVADLLDEDYDRCDADTMIRHKTATSLNYAHWLRHYLILKPPRIREGVCTIRIVQPKAWRDRIPATLEAMKFQMKEVERYNHLLAHLSADVDCQIEPDQNQVEIPTPIDYFDQAPDVHLLRAFEWQLNRIIELGQPDLNGILASMDRQGNAKKASFTRDRTATDHDAIWTLRAVRSFEPGSNYEQQAEQLAERAIRDANETGDITLAMKLIEEYDHARQ